METLNTIEKMTLLVSTGIVFLVNLFVMLEGAKKSRKQNSINVIQKLFGLKNTFFVFVLIFVMSSCSGSKFLNRKYISGRFRESKKSLTHNTIYVDTTKIYTSLNSNIELKKITVVLNNISEKKIINQKVESIIKKDSIFIYSRKGRNRTVVVKNSLPTVITEINRKGERVKAKILTTEKAAKVKRNYEIKIKVFSVLALCFSLVPILGFAFACTARRLIRQNKEANAFKYIRGYSLISDIALGFSIISSALGLLLAAFVVFVYSIAFFGGAASSVFFF